VKLYVDPKGRKKEDAARKRNVGTERIDLGLLCSTSIVSCERWWVMGPMSYPWLVGSMDLLEFVRVIVCLPRLSPQAGSLSGREVCPIEFPSFSLSRAVRNRAIAEGGAYGRGRE
jgi:hypothetical protein